MSDIEKPPPLASREFIHPQGAVAPGYLANHAARVFNRLVDMRLRTHDLSLALIRPLLVLSWKGPLLQRDLVRFSAVKQPAMVALLDKLETAGMIERTVTSTDRRAATIRLTGRGEHAAEIGRAMLMEVNTEAVSGLSVGETAAVVDLLTRLIQNLERHP